MHADLAWATGFYEGEGSISCPGQGLTLSVAQVNEEPLHRLVALFGGTVLRARNGAIAVWRLHGYPAQRAAMAMWPLLSRRRQDQVLRALLRFAMRSVRDPDRCRRGHLYAVVGKPRDECGQCREDRREVPPGPLPPLPRAIEIRMGMREYAPVIQT